MTSASVKSAGFTVCAAEQPDHRQHPLPRMRRERPRSSRAAEKRDECAPLHSITSSATTSSVCSMSITS